MLNSPALRFSAAILMLGLVTGCASTRSGTPMCRTVKIHQPKSPPIRITQRLNPIWWLGNMDDPVPPASYRPGKADRQWQWQLRNPFHNFTFYVIGVSDRPATRTGRFPTEVFPAGGGWNWAIHRYRFILLPFIAFEGARWRFYLGWRDTGNFGAKLNVGSREKWYPQRAMQTATANRRRNADTLVRSSNTRTGVPALRSTARVFHQSAKPSPPKSAAPHRSNRG